ncbi:MAG: AMIN domain-containing protein [Deltaproteobacteria bacterium]|nr:AMIN domain-containing protein [Deltaproteobacteria bacterium]
MNKNLLLVVLVIISTFLYAQEPVNILQSINVSSDSTGAVVGIHFNGPVSFTSMKLTDPFRIVLDFTDCKKGGQVKNSIRVNSDGIKEIAVSQMGSQDSPLTRVMIITTVDLEFNIEPTDDGINVRIAGVRLASVEESAKVPAEPSNVVEVTPKQQEEVKPEPKIASESTPRESESKSELTPAPAVAEAKAEPPPVEEKKKIKFTPAPAKVASNEPPRELSESTSVQTVGEAKAEPPPVEEKKKIKFTPAPAKVASNESESRPEHFKPTARKASSSGKNSLTWIGFQVSASGSRVFVKTIYEAEYSIKEKDDKTLVVEIYNTDIPKKNNRRPLDTSFFNSPVAYISPQVEGGHMKVVKIEIRLKKRVPFITKQESNALYIDFEGVN